MNFVLKTGTETLYDIDVTEGSFAFSKNNTSEAELFKEWEDLSETEKETLLKASLEFEETFKRLSQICHSVLEASIIKRAS